MDARDNADAWQELSRIDFLLDELARAVERGEVPRSSYDAMSPRYLSRRQALVAVLSAPAQPVASPPADWFEGAWDAAPAARPPAHAAHVRAPRPRHEISWTTVLLFLGAFLVIVASAIFTAAVWDIMGAGAKLGFLGSLTAGFYVAGWWARTKLGLRAGGVSLTVVASAMLLFDGWIAIDGYGLEGPLPWAVLMLVCWAAYWFTEVRLADRFFGVIGAAAQVAWWWLLGAGLGLTMPVRFAGVALVALVWQLAAERGRDDETVGSLASVLEWGAPAVAIGCLVGIAVDLAAVGTAGFTEVFAAGVVSAAAAVVLLRQRIYTPGRDWMAAAAQAPFLAVAWVAGGFAGSWVSVAAFALASLAYSWLALSRYGTSFAIADLLAEVALVFQVAAVVGPSSNDASGLLAALAALAALWALAARVALRADAPGSRWAGLASTALVARIGSLVLLGAVTLVTPTASGGPALVAATGTATHAALAGAVLLAWAVVVVAWPLAATLCVAEAWSFYAAAAAMGWLAPDRPAVFYTLALVLLAAVWLGLSQPVSRALKTDRRAPAWLARALVVLVTFAGLGVQLGAAFRIDTWECVLIVVGAAVFFAGDTLASDEPASAGLWPLFAVAAATIAGATAFGGRVEVAALAGTGAAVVAAAVGALQRRVRPVGGMTTALAAAVSSVPVAALAVPEPYWLAGALCLAAVAWFLAAYAAREEWLDVASGLALYAALWFVLTEAALPDAARFGVLAIAGLLFAAVAFAPAFGPGGRHAHAGAALSVAALVGLLGVCVVEWGTALGEPGAWFSLLPLALGAILVAEGVRWHVEPGLYAGFAFIVLALLSLLHAAGATTTELYTTPVAVYLSAIGYLFASREPQRSYPVALDIAATLVGLGVPAFLVLTSGGTEAAFTQSVWAIGLALAGIGLGVALRVRAYFFGGVALLAFTAVWRTLTYLAQFWWLLIGFIGIALLVIALTWEREKLVVSSARRRLLESFEGWR